MSLIRQVTTVGEQSSQGTMGVRASFSCRSNPVKIQFHQQHQSTPWFPVSVLFPAQRQPMWTPDICTDWWQKREEYDKSEKCDSQGAAASPDPVLTPGFQAPLLLHISRGRGHISSASHFPAAFLDSLCSASTGISLQSHSAPSGQTLHTVNKRRASWAAGYFYTFSNEFQMPGQAAKMPQQIIRSQESSPSSVSIWMWLLN